MLNLVSILGKKKKKRRFWKMAKAYKCDKCGKYFDGEAIIQMSFDKRSEIIFKYTLGIKYFDNGNIYFKDLCNKCAKSFCEWWQKKG
jgi:hypothetical protein